MCMQEPLHNFYTNIDYVFSTIPASSYVMSRRTFYKTPYSNTTKFFRGGLGSKKTCIASRCFLRDSLNICDKLGCTVVFSLRFICLSSACAPTVNICTILPIESRCTLRLVLRLVRQGMQTLGQRQPSTPSETNRLYLIDHCMPF